MRPPTCPQHHRRLEFDEALEECRMVGTLSFEYEETGRIVRYVCPEPGCREHRNLAA